MRLPYGKQHIGQVKLSLQGVFQQNAFLDFFWLNIGTFLIAVGLHFFKFPSHLNTGGISGLALVLTALWPSSSPATFMFIVNNILLLAGYVIFGKSFGFKTTYSSIMLSVMIWVLEQIYPMTAPLTQLPLLELMFGVLLPGFGAGIIFNINASNGGSDIIGMILKKFTALNIGTALGIVDLFIVLLSIPFFSAQIVLLNILGLFIKAFVTDLVIEGIRLHKYFTIITTKPELICHFINHQLNSSATITEAKGAFSGENRSLIFTVMRRSKALRLQKFLHENDPEAFLFITNTSEIIGKGFRGIS